MNLGFHSVEMGSDSDQDDEPESEEDSAESNPYPIEGKYIDEEDRERYVDFPFHLYCIPVSNVGHQAPRHVRNRARGYSCTTARRDAANQDAKPTGSNGKRPEWEERR